MVVFETLGFKLDAKTNSYVFWGVFLKGDFVRVLALKLN